MDVKTFDMIDGMLAHQSYRDERVAATNLLEVGVREGTLLDVARVIAERYAVRPGVIVEWYAEVLNRRVQETTELIKELTEQRVDNVGSE